MRVQNKRHANAHQPLTSHATTESGRIVIEPAQRKEYDLAELVKQITGENLHDEADFGRPVGKEAL